MREIVLTTLNASSLLYYLLAPVRNQQKFCCPDNFFTVEMNDSGVGLENDLLILLGTVVSRMQADAQALGR